MDNETDQGQGAEGGSEEHPSGKSSTADEASSIEALNWSDFEDDEQLSTADAALLQSIHSILSDDSGSGAEDGAKKMSTSVSSEMTTIMDDSAPAPDVEQEIETVSVEGVDEKIITEESVEKQGTKRKREESPVISNTLPVPSYTTNEAINGDLSSNAAVLDDGPIWAKGSKRYRFEENRRVNQKLTFGVLLSVVLALGLGLGNLVAYNECEAEHKDKPTETPCPMSSKSAGIATPSLPPILPTAESDAPPPTGHAPIPTTSIPHVPEPKVSKPMVDPKYSQHAEELSKVLKMLDELSRKIDRFENTTRQLGGIVMMRDELRVPEPPPTKKTKFLQLLSEVMTAKREKRAEVKPGHVRSWKDKKEEVLEDIAGAVLEAMQEDEVDASLEEEPKTFLESSQIFSVDEELIEPQETDFQELPPSLIFPPIVEEVDVEEVESDAEELPEDPLDILSEGKHAENLKILKRQIAVELDDEELQIEDSVNDSEFFEPPKEKLVKDKKPKTEKEKVKKFGKIVENGFEKEEKAKQKHRKHADEEYRRQKETEKLEKKRQKENAKLEKSKKEKPQKYDTVKQEKKKGEKYERPKVKENSDWVTARAENRESSRRVSEEEYNRKHKNWQTERSRLREEFRVLSNNNREV